MADARVAPSLPLWQWIPLSEYRRPVPPLQHHVGRFWRRRGAAAEDEPPDTLHQQAAVHHAIEEELADSLQHHLAAWFADPTAASLRLVVLPPHLHLEGVMRRVTSCARWRLMEPPSFAEISEGGDASRGRLVELGEAPVVVPALHRLFLRHADGMSRLRELLALLRLRPRRALLGCESWGWHYVRKVLHLDAIHNGAITLRPFDAERLAQWLPNGGGVSASVLQQLAAESGGNVAVASTLAAQLVENGTNAAQVGVTALAWRSRLPAWPPEWGRMETFVVHSLLIHGGLPVDALAHTILASADELHAALDRLAAAGLVEAHHATWYVTPLGYPAARTHLMAHGYGDDF